MHEAMAKVIAGLMLLGVLGCGSGQLPAYPVEGNVVFQDGGWPMFGTIEFYNQEHKINARGKLNRDGKFTLTTYKEGDGAIAGKHKVVIIQIVTDPTGPLGESKMKVVHNHGALVARKYLDYRTSGLACDIKQGINSVELVVEKGEKN